MSRADDLIFMQRAIDRYNANQERRDKAKMTKAERALKAAQQRTRRENEKLRNYSKMISAHKPWV